MQKFSFIIGLFVLQLGLVSFALGQQTNPFNNNNLRPFGDVKVKHQIYKGKYAVQFNNSVELTEIEFANGTIEANINQSIKIFKL